MRLLIHEFNRLAYSSIIATFTAIVLVYSSRNVGSSASVK